MSDEDDIPRLPADTLAILHEFYIEKEAREKLETIPKLDHNEPRFFEENWQLSQFWYDDKTVEAFTKIVSNVNLPTKTVCLISCPTLYIPLKKCLAETYTVKLLEFDPRFAVYNSDFIKYDFNDPLNIRNEYYEFFDLVIADPPFLSRDCLTQVSQTIKFLTKEKIVVCTGSVMSNIIFELFNLNICKFKPQHKNNLANDFSSFSNFNLDIIL